MTAQPDFTICVLLYGDFPQLAQRCLDSIEKLSGEFVLRVAANDVSAASQAIIDRFCKANWSRLECADIDEKNRLKYPVMRRLLHGVPDAGLPAIRTPYTMWFDDDSFVWPEGSASLLPQVATLLRTEGGMLGSLYKMSLQGQQADWIKQQPWYTGQPIGKMTKKGVKMEFATGGWWAIETALLRKHDWPPVAFQHRGGDVMTGALCQQQQIRLTQFREGVAINADDKGRESRSVRRGFNSVPVGFSLE